MTDSAWDPGVQNERTRLAWQRTILATLTIGLLVARLLMPHSPLVALVVGGGAVITSTILGVRSSRRYRRNHQALHAGGLLEDGRAHVLLATAVCVAAVGAFWFVTLL